MSYRKANDDLKFDVRMREINLAKDLINKSDVQTYETSLEDCANNAESLSIEEEVVAAEPAREQNPANNMMNTGFGSNNNGNEGFGSNGFTF